MPNRTPYRWGRVSPRQALRAGLVALALVLLVVLVAGCGNAELPRSAPAGPTPPGTSPPPPPATPAPTTVTTAPHTGHPTGAPPPPEGGHARGAGPDGTGSRGTGSPGGGSPGGGPQARGGTGQGGSGTPIWPATDAASAARLQQQVDGGRQPWLLDPTEVATSYAGVALKYRDPSVFTIRPGVVDVQDGASPAKATLTLAQTVRRGDGGIWLVTNVRRR